MRSECGAGALRLRAPSNNEHQTSPSPGRVARALIALYLTKGCRFNRDLFNRNLGESVVIRHPSELHEYVSVKLLSRAVPQSVSHAKSRKPSSKQAIRSLVWVATQCVAITGWEHGQLVDDAVVRRRVECVKDARLPVERSDERFA